MCFRSRHCSRLSRSFAGTFVGGTFWSSNRSRQRSCCSRLAANIAIRLAAAEFAAPLTMYASSSVTRYRNGLSPASSPDAFFPLTRPQMVSTDLPEHIFSHGPFHLAELGRRRILQLRSNRGLRLDKDWIGRLGRPDLMREPRLSLRSRWTPAFFPRVAALSRTAAVDRFSVFAAVADLTFAVAERFLDDVGAGSAGRLPVILLRPPKPFGSATCFHAGLRR